MKNWIYHNFSTCYIIILFMQTYAFAKDFSHFYLWIVKRLQKAVRANSPHLRQFANCTPSPLILTIQQTTQPLNVHVDPNFQQFNSICILQKRLQETALTPLHMWSHCERRVQENSRLAHSPQSRSRWDYFGCFLSGCAVWKERQGGSRPEQTRCAPRRRHQERGARGCRTSERTNSSRPGMVTVPQRWQRSWGTLKGEGGRSWKRRTTVSLPATPLLLKAWKGCLVLTRRDLSDPSMKITEKRHQTN